MSREDIPQIPARPSRSQGRPRLQHFDPQPTDADINLDGLLDNPELQELWSELAPAYADLVESARNPLELAELFLERLRSRYENQISDTESEDEPDNNNLSYDDVGSEHGSDTVMIRRISGTLNNMEMTESPRPRHSVSRLMLATEEAEGVVESELQSEFNFWRQLRIMRQNRNSETGEDDDDDDSEYVYESPVSSSNSSSMGIQFRRILPRNPGTSTSRSIPAPPAPPPSPALLTTPASSAQHEFLQSTWLLGTSPNGTDSVFQPATGQRRNSAAADPLTPLIPSTLHLSSTSRTRDNGNQWMYLPEYTTAASAAAAEYKSPLLPSSRPTAFIDPNDDIINIGAGTTATNLSAPPTAAVYIRHLHGHDYPER